MTNFWASIDHIVTNGGGDWASVFGVILSLVGFVITIIAVVRSKSASDQAKAAVMNVRNDIFRIDTVSDCGSALMQLEQIKTFQQRQDWDLLPDKYSSLRKSLISLKNSESLSKDEHQTVLQSTITLVANIEEKIIKALAHKKTDDLDFSKLNPLLSDHADKIQAILIKVKTQIGR
jgi:lipoate-protein ligase B